MTKIFNRIAIRWKLPAIMVLLIAVAIGMMGVMAYQNARETITAGAEQRLESIANSRIAAVEAWLAKTERDLIGQASNPLVQSTIRAFEGSISVFENPQAELQALYVTANPNPAGERDKLDISPANTAYDRNHKRVHPFLRAQMERMGYYDVFLFDLAGNLLYTVEKEADFGQNFAAGPLAGSGLGAAYREALAAPQGSVIFADYQAYAPSGGNPASFVATPVHDRDGVLRGVLAYQLPVEPVDAILNDPVGLGETGGAYLVGPDHLLRSNDKHSDTPTLLVERVESEAVTAALAGESGIVEGHDNEGRPAMIDFSPVSVLGETWALIVEQTEAELYEPAVALRNSFLLQGGIGLVIAVIVALLVSRSIAAPLGRVGDAMRAVAGRDYTVTVPATDRGDEIGGIAQNLEEFRLSLIEAETAAQALAAAEEEQKAKAAAQARVVADLQRALGQLSEGDLTANIAEPFSAEYEQLRTDFNGAMATLRGAMQGVVENAHLIRGEAQEISSAADDLSARTETQAATLEETAAALDELTASVKSAADGAGQAAEVVASARANAEASGEVVREAVDAMGQIESSSSQISKIISVIDDIAFQTNLLALNAGVEAARAGDAGRGFAVVASEVRALAQRSSEAAREINGLISASGGHVKRGVELVGEAGRALQSIFESVTNISEHVAEIATSAREQSKGLAEINDAVNQLDQVTQQNVAMFEETTAASHALTREAEVLTSTMARFRTGAAEIVVPEFKPAKRAAAARGASSPKPRPAPTKAARAAAAVAVAEATVADEGWTEF